MLNNSLILSWNLMFRFVLKKTKTFRHIASSIVPNFWRAVNLFSSRFIVAPLLATPSKSGQDSKSRLHSPFLSNIRNAHTAHISRRVLLRAPFTIPIFFYQHSRLDAAGTADPSAAKQKSILSYFK